MGAAMTTVPLAALNGAAHRQAGLTFGPVAADIEEADRIFAATLAPYRSPVAPLVNHLRHYRGKRLRPALLLLTAKAFGRGVGARSFGFFQRLAERPRSMQFLLHAGYEPFAAL